MLWDGVFVRRTCVKYRIYRHADNAHNQYKYLLTVCTGVVPSHTEQAMVELDNNMPRSIH